MARRGENVVKIKNSSERLLEIIYDRRAQSVANGMVEEGSIFFFVSIAFYRNMTESLTRRRLYSLILDLD